MSNVMQISKDNLRVEIDAVLDQYIERVYKDIPYASHQKDAKDIDLEYYKRHSIETPIRIKLKRTIDALVIHHFTKTNPKAAKDWAHYTDDEMLHGQMFAKDIERQWGLSFAEVMAHRPLLSTQLLNGYFYFHLEYEGPMAAIASAYFLEYVTSKTQPIWLDNLEKQLGKEATIGARAHVTQDLDEDHNGFVWNTLMQTVHTEDDAQRLKEHIKNIFSLFGAYLHELYEVTVGKREGKESRSIAAQAITYAQLSVA